MTPDTSGPPTYYILVPAPAEEIEALFAEFLALEDPPSWLDPDQRQWPLEVHRGSGAYTAVFDDEAVDSLAPNIGEYLSTRFAGPVYVNGINTDSADFVDQFEGGVRTDVLMITDSWEFARGHGCEIPRWKRHDVDPFPRADAIVVEGVDAASLRELPIIQDATDIAIRNTAHGAVIVRDGAKMVSKQVDREELSKTMGDTPVFYVIFFGDLTAPNEDNLACRIYRSGELCAEFSYPDKPPVLDAPLVETLFGADAPDGILDALGLDRNEFLPWTTR